MTQDQVNAWLEFHDEEQKSVEDFIEGFDDYTKEGLTSLLAVLTMCSEMQDDEIEKSKVYFKPDKGEKPPKGYQAQKGPKGGYYYETKSPSGKDHPSDAEYDDFVSAYKNHISLFSDSVEELLSSKKPPYYIGDELERDVEKLKHTYTLIGLDKHLVNSLIDDLLINKIIKRKPVGGIDNKEYLKYVNAKHITSGYTMFNLLSNSGKEQLLKEQSSDVPKEFYDKLLDECKYKPYFKDTILEIYLKSKTLDSKRAVEQLINMGSFDQGTLINLFKQGELRGMITRKLSYDSITKLIGDKRIDSFLVKKPTIFGSAFAERGDDRLIVRFILLSDEQTAINFIEPLFSYKHLTQILNDGEIRWVLEEFINRSSPKGLNRLIDTIYGHSSAIDEWIDERSRKLGKVGHKAINKAISGQELTVEDFSPDIREDIFNLTGDYRDITEKLHSELDILFEVAGFGETNNILRGSWLDSSNSMFAGALKVSAAKNFGGTIRFHEHDLEEHLNGEYREGRLHRQGAYHTFSPEVIDKYFIMQKNLTRVLLDIKYPDRDEFILFRGTSKNEVEFTRSKLEREERKLFDRTETGIPFSDAITRSNPISSWSTKFSTASKFASDEDGTVIAIKVPKDEVWSSFLTYSHSGFEGEMIVLSPKARKTKCINIDDIGLSSDISDESRAEEIAELFERL